MVGRIYRKRTNIRESYEFSVRYGRNTRRLFRFYDYERAVLCHDRLTLIEEKAQAVFASLKAQSEYSEMEPDVKILAEQIGGIWTPDKIYNHFKTLFLLSGPELSLIHILEGIFDPTVKHSRDRPHLRGAHGRGVRAGGVFMDRVRLYLRRGGSRLYDRHDLLPHGRGIRVGNRGEVPG